MGVKETCFCKLTTVAYPCNPCFQFGVLSAGFAFGHLSVGILGVSCAAEVTPFFMRGLSIFGIQKTGMATGQGLSLE